jgi:hypothetical protein
MSVQRKLRGFAAKGGWRNQARSFVAAREQTASDHDGPAYIGLLMEEVAGSR